MTNPLDNLGMVLDEPLANIVRRNPDSALPERILIRLACVQTRLARREWDKALWCVTTTMEEMAEGMRRASDDQ